MQRRRSQRIQSVFGPYLFFWKIEVRVSILDLLGFDFRRKREGNEIEGLLGHLTRPINQVNAIEFKRNSIRGRSKSPREATIVAVVLESRISDLMGGQRYCSRRSRKT